MPGGEATAALESMGDKGVERPVAEHGLAKGPCPFVVFLRLLLPFDDT